MKISLKLLLPLAVLGSLVLLAAGCANDMERSGVSNRPQNSPASWENQKGTIDIDK